MEIPQSTQTPFSEFCGLMPHRSKITKQHIERLSVLVKRKAALEEKILFCVTKLEKSYMNANREVHVTISGRRNDIEAMKNIHVGQPEKHLELS